MRNENFYSGQILWLVVYGYCKLNFTLKSFVSTYKNLYTEQIKLYQEEEKNAKIDTLVAL